MIIIKATTISDAWKKTCLALYATPEVKDNDELLRDSPAVIEVSNVYDDLFDARFPMTKKQVETISNFLLTGKNESEVVHDWTKVYRHRLFDSSVNQIEKIVTYLKAKPQGKKAQASLWNSETDFSAKIAPCLQVLWFQVIDGQLDLHVHMRASDGYGKLLMNMHEFTALQKDIAMKLGVKAGKYIHFIDTCHFNRNDQTKVETLIQELT